MPTVGKIIGRACAVKKCSIADKTSPTNTIIDPRVSKFVYMCKRVKLYNESEIIEAFLSRCIAKNILDRINSLMVIWSAVV